MDMNEAAVPVSMVHVERSGGVIAMSTQTVSELTETPKKKRKSTETQATGTMTWPYGHLPSCSTCSKVFKNSSQLSQHMLVHSNERKHKCTYCEKAFKQLSHLQQHTRMHTGEKPYKCKVEGCNRGFAQMANLHHHMRSHEKDVDQKVGSEKTDWHSCDECAQMFASSRGLACHKQKAHTKYDPAKGGPPATPPKTKRKRNSSGKEGVKSDFYKEQHNEVSSSTSQVADNDYASRQTETVSPSVYSRGQRMGVGDQQGMKLPTVATIVTPGANEELPHIPASVVISTLQQ